MENKITDDKVKNGITKKKKKNNENKKKMNK